MRGETRYPCLVPGHYSSYPLTMKTRVGPDTTRTLITVKKLFLRILEIKQKGWCVYVLYVMSSGISLATPLALNRQGG